MTIAMRMGIVVLIGWGAICGSAGAQAPTILDRPAPAKSFKPFSKEELDQREARKLFALGLLYQYDDRLLDATRTFEEAARLDPKAAPLHRILIPLYLALARTDNALDACRQTLALDDDDFETWQIYARELKILGCFKESAHALARAFGCPALVERPDLRAQIALDLGALREEMKDFDEAVAAFSEAVKVLDRPQNFLNGDYNLAEITTHAVETYERLIKLCIKAGKLQQALVFYSEARKLYPTLARRLSFQLAKVYQAQGQVDNALACVDEYLSTEPPGTEAYEVRRELLLKLGKSEKQVALALEPFVERDVFNIPLRLLLAQQYARTGEPADLAKAQKIYAELADKAPTVEVYRAWFGVIRECRQGSPGAAILDMINDAITRSGAPTNRNGKETLAAAQVRVMLLALQDDLAGLKNVSAVAVQRINKGEGLRPQTKFLLAVLAARSGRLDEAELFYRGCLGEHAPDRLPQEQAAYLGLLRILWAAHKYEAIVGVCRDALKHAPAPSQLLFHYHLARALALLGEGKEAIAEADRAVDLASEDERLGQRLNRMFVLSLAGMHKQALAEGDTLLRTYPDTGKTREIRMALYSVYQELHDLRRSEEQLQLILRSDPDDATANNDLGYLWADQAKNLDAAERMIRKALELDGREKARGGDSASPEKENGAYLDSLGWVLFRKGQVQAALGYLERAAAVKDVADDPVVWDHLGEVYSRLSQLDQARMAWQKSLHLYESSRRQRRDDHYLELKNKLHLLDAQTREQ